MLLMGKFVSSLSNGMQLVSPSWIHYGLMAASVRTSLNSVLSLCFLLISEILVQK
jgi:hypothetical protein